ncbi:alanyl-tRNA editing protein [Candidatus Roizmanbacteria bacterium]|nr:alanyl-tRNA editing protein [Candidatus Roizmanbacteria bacterium]
MKTQQSYLNNSYIKEMGATVLAIKPEGQNRYRLLLDSTVFYPMGGGQPTDQGKLTHENWTGDVYQVMIKDGEVWHYANETVIPEVNWLVRGAINWERRYQNMRRHSAGHLVDFALYQLGYSPKLLMPFKGDHGKKPFIMYRGTTDEDIKQKLEDKTNELVGRSLKFTTEFQPFEKLQQEAIYLQPGLPNNKPLRTLRLETVGAVADGGTQVGSTKEVGEVKITAIEKKEGNTVIYYQIG